MSSLNRICTIKIQKKLLNLAGIPRIKSISWLTILIAIPLKIGLWPIRFTFLLAHGQLCLRESCKRSQSANKGKRRNHVVEMYQKPVPHGLDKSRADILFRRIF